MDAPTDFELGFILEVDLHYPDELHDDHRDFPHAPTKETISYKDLVFWQHDLLEGEGVLRCQSQPKKLIQTLSDKNSYTVHYIALKLYVSLGWQIMKLHRVLLCQEPWLKPYIQLNTEKQ